MFSKTVEYALRAVVHLAQALPDTRKTSEVAQSTKVPPAYLAKVLQSLASKGIVKMTRGIGGGVTLARDIHTTTILDIVNAVEPIQRISHCPLDLKGHGTHLCALHRRMDTAIAQMETAFRLTTVAQLLSEPNTSVPLCDKLTKIKKDSDKQ